MRNVVLSAEQVGELHAVRVNIVESALAGILPGSACAQDDQGRWTVQIGSHHFYINGIAHVVVDALTEAEGK